MEQAQVLEAGEWLTPRQVAERKGVSVAAVYAAIEANRLPSSLILGRMAVRVSDAEAYEPTRYAGRSGAKGRGGRPKGVPMSEDAKARIAASQAKRWARKKKQPQVLDSAST